MPDTFLYIMRYIISMASTIDARARRWGDSLAVILPRQTVTEEGIRANDVIHLTIQKETNLGDLFGRWKTKKTAQELKDESRKAWD